MCSNGHCAEEREQMNCECPSGRMTRFIEPCLLFLLSGENSYGYELMENLKRFGLMEESPDPAMVYRTLRYLEKNGFVKSKWDTEGTGPAKRNYKITEKGLSSLRGWAAAIKERMKYLDKFLALYKKASKGTAGK